MILIVDLQYFAPVTLYSGLYKSTNIVFEQCDSYQKMSFRNRCQIVGAEGLINLSVPLVNGRDQKSLMKDVRISDLQPWQARHWKTIVSCYSRSPWFEFYRDDLEALYKKPFDFLIDWNLACFTWTLREMKIPAPVSMTQVYRKDYDPAEWMDWRGRLLPRNKEGIGSASSGGVALVPISYRQVFEERVGFFPNLSILDLLFCEGKGAAALLTP